MNVSVSDIEPSHHRKNHVLLMSIIGILETVRLDYPLQRIA